MQPIQVPIDLPVHEMLSVGAEVAQRRRFGFKAIPNRHNSMRIVTIVLLLFIQRYGSYMPSTNQNICLGMKYGSKFLRKEKRANESATEMPL